jgi:hypothetical protein
MLKGYKRHRPPKRGVKSPTRKQTGGKRQKGASATKKDGGKVARAQDRRDRRMLDRHQLKRLTKGSSGKKATKKAKPQMLKLLQKKQPQRPGSPGHHSGKWRARGASDTVVAPAPSRMGSETVITGRLNRRVSDIGTVPPPPPPQPTATSE